MQSYLSSRSLNRLGDAHPKLEELITKSVFHLAQTYPQENWHCEVSEVLRTVERQKELVAMGASRTLKSYHLKHADGWSHAVDLFAQDSLGVARWEEPLYFKMATSVRVIAIQLAIDVTWGGIWDRRLNNIPIDVPLERASMEYVARYRLQNPGKRPLFDGPHFQIELP